MLSSLLLVGALMAAPNGPDPDPSIALGYSIVIGFGTGEFYAGNKKRGIFFLSTEALSLAATYAAYKSNGRYAPKVFVGGETTFVLLKGAEILLTPMDAHKIAYPSDTSAEIGEEANRLQSVRTAVANTFSKLSLGKDKGEAKTDAEAKDVVRRIYADLAFDEDDDFEDAVAKVEILLADGKDPDRIVAATVAYVNDHPDVTVLQAITILSQ